MKKYRHIPYDVSVNYNKNDNELHIWSDKGRLLRPLFKVNKDNNTIDVNLNKEADFLKLFENDVIEYIDPEKTETVIITNDFRYLKEYKCDYMEIHPSTILG